VWSAGLFWGEKAVYLDTVCAVNVEMEEPYGAAGGWGDLAERDCVDVAAAFLLCCALQVGEVGLRKVVDGSHAS